MDIKPASREYEGARSAGDRTEVGFFPESACSSLESLRFVMFFETPLINLAKIGVVSGLAVAFHGGPRGGQSATWFSLKAATLTGRATRAPPEDRSSIRGYLVVMSQTPWGRRNSISCRAKLRQHETGLPNHNPEPTPAWLGGAMPRRHATTKNSASSFL